MSIEAQIEMLQKTIASNNHLMQNNINALKQQADVLEQFNMNAVAFMRSNNPDTETITTTKESADAAPVQETEPAKAEQQTTPKAASKKKASKKKTGKKQTVKEAKLPEISAEDVVKALKELKAIDQQHCIDILEDYSADGMFGSVSPTDYPELHTALLNKLANVGNQETAETDY